MDGTVGSQFCRPCSVWMFGLLKGVSRAWLPMLFPNHVFSQLSGPTEVNSGLKLHCPVLNRCIKERMREAKQSRMVPSDSQLRPPRGSAAQDVDQWIVFDSVTGLSRLCSRYTQVRVKPIALFTELWTGGSLTFSQHSQPKSLVNSYFVKLSRLILVHYIFMIKNPGKTSIPQFHFNFIVSHFR